eukprot:GILI01039060.1.p2 GENE.GILI01039060.1~~GILI01039060.1.p2  ORF type:complete len:151 (+),score=23.38 GILI01039060.1:79-531(+)
MKVCHLRLKGIRTMHHLGDDPCEQEVGSVETNGKEEVRRREPRHVLVESVKETRKQKDGASPETEQHHIVLDIISVGASYSESNERDDVERANEKILRLSAQVHSQDNEPHHTSNHEGGSLDIAKTHAARAEDEETCENDVCNQEEANCN